MADNLLPHVRATDSHSIKLFALLLDLGIIPRGKFTWVHVWHDGDCPALASGTALDCRCNPEVEVATHRYLYSDFMEPESKQ